jgi:hypothetical protein
VLLCFYLLGRQQVEIVLKVIEPVRRTVLNPTAETYFICDRLLADCRFLCVIAVFL